MRRKPCSADHGVVKAPRSSTTSIVAFVMSDRFTVPGRFHIRRMRNVQIDAPNFGSVLDGDDDLLGSLIEIERLDQRISIKARRADRPNVTQVFRVAAVFERERQQVEVLGLESRL